MFGLGMGEILIILVVALLFLGPKELPQAASKIGKAIRELRKHTQNLQETIEQDENIGGTVRELRSALRGDVLYTPPVPQAKPPEGEKPVAQETPGGSPPPAPAATPGPVAQTTAAADKPAEPAGPASPSSEAPHHG